MTQTAPKGYLSLMLHAHLPFVRHPEHEDPFEEDWLHEAITETYLPLLAMMERLAREEVPFRLTMSLTPTLLAMLEDPLLMGRYERRIESLIEFAEREVLRTRFQPEFNRTAQLYLERFRHARHLFVDRYQRRIPAAFARFRDQGSLEIVTCTATHGYLPLMHRRESVRAQVFAAADYHRRVLGKPARGIWLAECGYAPGVEETLAEAGLRFFFMDTHGVLLGSPRPRHGCWAPVLTRAGVAAFARDQDSSRQVWSSREGYPGDWDYRDFYRDAGYDLEFEYVRPYIHSSGLRKFTGLKYHRITGATETKEPYDPERAKAKAGEHAANFLHNRGKQVDWLEGMMGGRPPVVVAPYDAELFGHWWFEGPEFLEQLFRRMHFDQNAVKPTTPWEHMERTPRMQVVQPSESSWGYQGYHEVWLNESNDWIYRHLHQAADRMVDLANAHAAPAPLLGRVLAQAAREVLLAQSSDWPFIMKTGTVADYATRRVEEHVARFHHLAQMAEGGAVDQPWLEALEARDNLFPELDYRVFRSDYQYQQ